MMKLGPYPIFLNVLFQDGELWSGPTKFHLRSEEITQKKDNSGDQTEYRRLYTVSKMSIPTQQTRRVGGGGEWKIVANIFILGPWFVYLVIFKFFKLKVLRVGGQSWRNCAWLTRACVFKVKKKTFYQTDAWCVVQLIKPPIKYTFWTVQNKVGGF